MILDLRAQSARASHSASARAGRNAAFVVVAAFVVSRICYAIMGVRFDASTLNHYHQLIDPALLKGSLIESIFYLRDQPPSFNLMCGVVLKASGAHAATVFHAVYLGLGLCASIAALQLMLRMGVGAITAAAITILLTVNPTTVLYENWLLYEYPLMTGLIIAAWLLHRYASDRRLIDGAALLAVLALIVLTRGTFHPFWLVIVVVGVVLLDRAGARRTLRLAAAPLVLVAAVTLKNWVMFGEWAGSSVYRGLNLAVMTVDQLPREQCAELVRSGALSQAAVTPLYDRPPSAFVHLAPMGEPAGIAVLDQERKSTGAINWHHRAMPAIAAAYERDALYVLRHQPALYFGGVWKNLRRYFVPSHDTYPFNLAANANHARLKPALGFFDHWVGLRWGKTPYSWSALVLLPVLIAFAALAGVGPIRLRKRLMVTSMPDRAVLAFCLFNILYAAVTTILLSYGDHHRYRFALMPLYGVIAALLVSRVAAALGGRRSAAENDRVDLEVPAPSTRVWRRSVAVANH